MADSALVDWIVFQLLHFEAITPGDTLDMWRQAAADDGRVVYHLRNVLAIGGPLPALAGITVAVRQDGYQRPVTLAIATGDAVSVVTEDDLVAAARRLLDAAGSPILPAGYRLTIAPLPLPPSPPPAAQFSLF